MKITPAFEERYPKPVSNVRKLVGSTFEPPDSAVLAEQQREFEQLIAAAIAAQQEKSASATGEWAVQIERLAANQR